MSNYWVVRILQAVPLWIGASIIVFLMMQLAPGDPATLVADPSFLSEQQLLEVRESLGLEDPLPVQYFKTMALIKLLYWGLLVHQAN